MILIEKTNVMGFEQAIRAIRNPMNSSDSGICKGGDDGIGCVNCAANPCSHGYDHSFQIGKNDYYLMMKLIKSGPVHAEFRRMITVYVDITAPLYWWKEFDTFNATYKVDTVAYSCSTMHKIHDKKFEMSDFSTDRLLPSSFKCLGFTVKTLNDYRDLYLECEGHNKKDYWWQMIQLLPSSYNQKRTIMLNYEVLAGIYEHRKNHEFDEWKEFCKWVDLLPWSAIITCNSIKKGELSMTESFLHSH
ncbi:MAG TPA: hypothetical protein GXZ35_05470 [Acholeplasmataceae bacterium]|nr:hypothetical protein [Acholeplasmataceae bacterium]